MNAPQRTNQICGHCLRRRHLKEIHRTGGGFVARIDYEPCTCPGAVQARAGRAANYQVGAFGSIVCALSAVGGVATQAPALLTIGVAGVLICFAVMVLNRPRRDR